MEDSKLLNKKRKRIFYCKELIRPKFSLYDSTIRKKHSPSENLFFKIQKKNIITEIFNFFEFEELHKIYRSINNKTMIKYINSAVINRIKNICNSPPKYFYVQGNYNLNDFDNCYKVNSDPICNYKYIISFRFYNLEIDFENSKNPIHVNLPILMRESKNCIFIDKYIFIVSLRNNFYLYQSESQKIMMLKFNLPKNLHKNPILEILNDKNYKEGWNLIFKFKNSTIVYKINEKVEEIPTLICSLKYYTIANFLDEESESSYFILENKKIVKYTVHSGWKTSKFKVNLFRKINFLNQNYHYLIAYSLQEAVIYIINKKNLALKRLSIFPSELVFLDRFSNKHIVVVTKTSILILFDVYKNKVIRKFDLDIKLAIHTTFLFQRNILYIYDKSSFSVVNVIYIPQDFSEIEFSMIYLENFWGNFLDRQSREYHIKECCDKQIQVYLTVETNLNLKIIILYHHRHFVIAEFAFKPS